MNEVHEQAEQSSGLSWSGVLDVRNSTEYYQVLSQQLANLELLLIDCAAVERMDTAFIQMLKVFIESCNRRGKPVLLRHLPSTIQEAWALLGLNATLENRVVQEPVAVDDTL